MPADNPRQIVDQFMRLLNQVFSGDPVNPFEMFELLDESVNYVRQGIEPVLAKCRSRAEVGEKVLPPEVLAQIKLTPGFGLYPIEYIQEGNRIVLITKGRVSNIYGIPYNNTYFLLFEVVNGKIVRVVEDLDASLSLRCLYHTHLKEGFGPQP